VRRGLKSIDEGKGIPHEQVKAGIRHDTGHDTRTALTTAV
jgi:hypothetical protein